MNIAATGILCLGILVGILIAYYVEEAKVMNFKVLSGSVWMLAGSGVIAIFRLVDPQTAMKDEYWFYPIGLLAGFVFGTYIEWLWVEMDWWPPEAHAKRRRKKSN